MLTEMIPVSQLFLSVACYVVKSELQNFKHKEKCGKQKEICRYQQKTADFVGLLSALEPPVPSLPIQEKLFFLVVGYCVLSFQTSRAPSDTHNLLFVF